MNLRKMSVWGVCLGLVTVLCAGCAPATGRVTGTVSYKNKPLPGGSLTFVTPNGSSTTAINNDGTYKAEGVPVGTAKVSVFYSSGPKMGGRGGAGGKDRMTVPKDLPPEALKAFQGAKQQPSNITVPAKYNDPETSGLTVTVTSGDNPPYNIDLKD